MTHMSLYSRISTLSLLATLTGMPLLITACDTADEELAGACLDAEQSQEKGVELVDEASDEALDEAAAAGKAAAQDYTAIADAVAEHNGELQDCYKAALASDPTLAGRVVLAFTIDASGSVSELRSAEDTLGGGVSECLHAAARSWNLPPSTGTTEVRYPFVFTPDAATRTPRIRMAAASSEGALDKDIIRRIVRAHINEVRHCYNQGLTRDPELAGRVIANFTISHEGHVAELPAITTSVGDVEVDTCVASAIQRWRFPKSKDGEAVSVTYPFVLSPG